MTASQRGRRTDDVTALLDRYAAERLDQDPVERLLRRYAARLEPDEVTGARTRSAVLGAVAARAARPGRVPRPLLGRIALRPLAALAGATLAVSLAVGGAYAASQPGGPFYGTRLWLETITLPASGQARVDADVVRLESRLAEAQDAARSGDVAALQAALFAYDQTVEDALQAAGGQLDKQQRLEAILLRHQALLESLAARLPSNAAEAVQEVLARTSATIQQIQAGGGPGNGGNGAAGGPSGSATPAGNGGNGNGNGGPGKTPPGQANQASPKPSHQPGRPTASAPPAAATPTPAPNTPTPRPHPTPAPSQRP